MTKYICTHCKTIYALHPECCVKCACKQFDEVQKDTQPTQHLSVEDVVPPESICKDCERCRKKGLTYCSSCNEPLITETEEKEIEAVPPDLENQLLHLLDERISALSVDASRTDLNEEYLESILEILVEQDQSEENLVSEIDLETIPSQLRTNGREDLATEAEKILEADNVFQLAKEVALIWLLDQNNRLTTRTNGCLWVRGERIGPELLIKLWQGVVGHFSKEEGIELLNCSVLGEWQKTMCGKTWLKESEQRRIACHALAADHDLTQSLHPETAELNALRSPEHLISDASEAVKRIVDSSHPFLRHILEKNSTLTYSEAWLIQSLDSRLLKIEDHYPNEERVKDLAGLRALLLLRQGKRLTTFARLIHPGVFFGFLFIGFGVLMIYLQKLNASGDVMIFPGWALVWLCLFPLITCGLELLYRLKRFRMHRELAALLKVADLNLTYSRKQKHQAHFWERQAERAASGLAERMQEDGVPSMGLTEIGNRYRQLYTGCLRVGPGNLGIPFNCPPVNHGGKLARAFFLPPVVACAALFLPSSWYQNSSDWIRDRSHPFLLTYHTRISSLESVGQYLREKRLYEDMIEEHGENFRQYAPRQYNDAKNTVSEGMQSGNTRVRAAAYAESVAIMEAVLVEQKELYQLRNRAENAYLQLDTVHAEKFFSQRLIQLRSSLEKTYASHELEAAKEQYRGIQREIQTLHTLIQECKMLDAELNAKLRTARGLVQSLEQKPLHSLDQAKVEEFKLRVQEINTAHRSLETLRSLVGNAGGLASDLEELSGNVNLGHAWVQQFQILWEGIEDEREEIEQHFPEAWQRIQRGLDEIERTPVSQAAGMYQTLYGQVHEAIASLDQSRRTGGR